MPLPRRMYQDPTFHASFWKGAIVVIALCVLFFGSMFFVGRYL